MRHETDMPEWADDIKCIDTRWVQWNEMGMPSDDITAPDSACDTDTQPHKGPRMIWSGSGVLDFINVTDGHLYGTSRINEVCHREFWRTIRPKLPEDVRTTKGLRKKIASSISYGGPTPKCTFFFDTNEGGRHQLGSFYIIAEGEQQQ